MPLLLTLLAGCAADPEPVEAPPPPPVIEMGTGEWDWEPLEPGQEIDVIQGPQGGFHLLGSVRVKGLEAGTANDLTDPNNPTTQFWVVHNGENLSPGSRFIQGLDPTPEEDGAYSHQMVGRFIIMNILADDELDGEEVTFGVSVDDVNGERVETEMTLTTVPHPLNL